MLPPPEPGRRNVRLVAGYALFAGLLILATTPIYLSAQPSTRGAVVRLAAGVFVGAILLPLGRALRRWIDAQPPSRFELALERTPAEPVLAAPFLKLRDEVRNSARDQRYFEHVLWERILALLSRLPSGSGEVIAAKPRGRRFSRRGPSLAALRDLIAAIEERL
jgi:hypothetical protein